MKSLSTLLFIFTIAHVSQISCMKKPSKELLWQRLFMRSYTKNNTHKYDVAGSMQDIGAINQKTINKILEYFRDGNYNLPVPSLGWQLLIDGGHINKGNGRIALKNPKTITVSETKKDSYYPTTYGIHTCFIKPFKLDIAPEERIFIIQLPCWDQTKCWTREFQEKTLQKHPTDKSWGPCGCHSGKNSLLFADYRDINKRQITMQKVVSRLNDNTTKATIQSCITEYGTWLDDDGIMKLMGTKGGYFSVKKGNTYLNYTKYLSKKAGWQLKGGTLASIYNRKPVAWHPGLRFKRLKSPEVFILNTGTHWFAAVVEYMPNGQIAVIFADSLFGKDYCIHARKDYLIQLVTQLLTAKIKQK